MPEARRSRAARTRPKVALLIESSRGYGQGLLEGIAKYLRARSSWAVYFQERRLGDPPPEWLAGWRGDGVIARIEDRRLGRALKALRVPVIDVRGLWELGFPVIDTDERAVVAQALEHLRERGFRRFAFCGFKGANYSENRCRQLLAQAGRDEVISIFDASPQKARGKRGCEQHGLARELEIARWLKTLPRPAAVLACNDVCGQQVLNACRFAELAVPDEIAVLGVDDDALLCELSDPPLSSVRPDTRRIGHLAAERLDAMMRGKTAKAGTTLVAPLGVAARRSTDVFALEDREMAAALRYIRNHVGEGINVDDVVRESAMSRSQFERRFAAALNRTPKEELTAVRLQRVKELLAASDLGLREVARLAGFQHHEHMFAFFKRLAGCTPRAYRKRTRLC